MMRYPSFNEFLAPQFEIFRSWTNAVALMAETQAVIGFRMLGLAGIWAVTPSENRRMVDEKLPAFTEALIAGTIAGSRGRSPAQIMDATLRPLRRRTRQNSRRLAKRGPRLPKR